MMREGHADIFDRKEAIRNHIFAIKSLMNELTSEQRFEIEKDIAFFLLNIDTRTEEERLLDERINQIVLNNNKKRRG